MSKARTYNLDSGKRSGEDGILQEPSMRSELISIASPVHQGSDIFTDFGDNKDSPTKKAIIIQSEEYDPFGMDEYNEDNFQDQSISTKFSKVNSFQKK